MSKTLKYLLLACLGAAALVFSGCRTSVRVVGPGYYNLDRCYWDRITNQWGWYEDLYCWNPHFGVFYPYRRGGLIVRRYAPGWRGTRIRYARAPRRVRIVRRDGTVRRGGGVVRGGRRGGGVVRGGGGGTVRRGGGSGTVRRGGGGSSRRSGGGGSVSRGGSSRRSGGGGSISRGGGSSRGGGISRGGSRGGSSRGGSSRGGSSRGGSSRGGGRSRGRRLDMKNLFAADLELPSQHLRSISVGGAAFDGADINTIDSDGNKAILKAVIHAENKEAAQRLVDQISSQNRHFRGDLNLQDRNGFNCEYAENEEGVLEVTSGACVSFTQIETPNATELELEVEGERMELELSNDASDDLAGSIESDF